MLTSRSEVVRAETRNQKQETLFWHYCSLLLINKTQDLLLINNVNINMYTA